MDTSILSWGRAHRYSHSVHSLDRLKGFDGQNVFASQNAVFHGMGRSYGDVALNDGGGLIKTTGADCVISFDRQIGRFKAYSGLTLAQILKVIIPAGWFLPVSPGTKYVTLGGAVANDVHGKNHHHAGSFGAHVLALMLVRSNGERLYCSREENAEMFEATISGLGLTGFIEWVEFQLKPIRSSNLYVENIRYKNLDEFLQLSLDSQDWPYSVAWIDCFLSGNKTGGGIFSRARFADDGIYEVARAGAKLKMPFTPPAFLLNRFSISAFNKVYKNRPNAFFKGVQNYAPFFYPLDAIQDWNKLYGSKGFFQHQSIIPMREGEAGVRALLKTISDAGQGSFLAVLKVYGKETSPGLNSFPLEGVSLALDFANRGERIRKLLTTLDQIVCDHGGRMYPAKDGMMSAETFMMGYPNWKRLEALRDPKISSSFWRRVTS